MRTLVVLVLGFAWGIACTNDYGGYRYPKGSGADAGTSPESPESPDAGTDAE